ncbi:MAG: hypothetical protein SYR96_11960 [Actinomycetota bacterium]|nr:hypothetical protein [Actinomycetota bacterium]
MTDDRIDELVRAADPYRRIDVDAEKQALLEEIMGDKPSVSLARRLVPALAAAAAVTAVLAVTVVTRDNPVRPEAAPATTAPAMTGGNGRFSALALAAAEKNPRLLIGEPGWTATDVNGFAEDSGEVVFRKDGRSLQMTWYPATAYASYHDDRKRVSVPEPTKVAGRKADVFTYTADDFAAMLEPSGSTFVELRTGGGWTRAAFDQVITKVEQVDVETWLAALPASIVTPERAGDALDKVLTDIPLPPGFDRAQLTGLGVNDPYQFGAQVTGPVACAWLDEYFRADDANDDAAKVKAEQALRGTHNWNVLKQMKAEGDWSETLWEYADKAVDADNPGNYREGLGCD